MTYSNKLPSFPIQFISVNNKSHCPDLAQLNLSALFTSFELVKLILKSPRGPILRHSTLHLDNHLVTHNTRKCPATRHRGRFFLLSFNPLGAHYHHEHHQPAALYCRFCCCYWWDGTICPLLLLYLPSTK